MAEQDNSEDVDVYISPRRFMGCTPGPKASRQKVFQENEEERAQEEKKKKSENVTLGIEEELDSPYDPKREEREAAAHKSIGNFNVIGKAVLFVNCIAGIAGMFLLAISLWVTLGEKNGGIAAFVFTEGIFLKSPLAIGLCLMVASLLCLITGGFIGPRKVSNTILAGMESAKHRKALGWYQLLATTSVILFALVLVSTVTPINKLNERGITPSLWRDMSLSHPDRICTFEVENKCAGSRNQTCTSISARINKGCPGHYCYSNCASASGRRRTNSSTCATCKSSFSSLKSLKRCKGSEANSSTSGTCLDILRKEVKRFYMIATISSGIGLSCMVLVSIVGTLGPILSAHY